MIKNGSKRMHNNNDKKIKSMIIVALTSKHNAVFMDVDDDCVKNKL